MSFNTNLVVLEDWQLRTCALIKIRYYRKTYLNENGTNLFIIKLQWINVQTDFFPNEFEENVFLENFAHFI